MREIDKCLYHPQKAGFYVRAVISVDHASSVRTFKWLLDSYNGVKNLFIYHPAHNETLKTYLFFDKVHLVKNIRNNLFSRNLFSQSFHLVEFRDLIETPNGFISRKTFYESMKRIVSYKRILEKLQNLLMDNSSR